MSKLTNDVDDAKNETPLAEHGQVGAPLVVQDGSIHGLDLQMLKHLHESCV